MLLYNSAVTTLFTNRSFFPCQGPSHTQKGFWFNCLLLSGIDLILSTVAFLRQETPTYFEYIALLPSQVSRLPHNWQALNRLFLQVLRSVCSSDVRPFPCYVSLASHRGLAECLSSLYFYITCWRTWQFVRLLPCCLPVLWITLFSQEQGWVLPCNVTSQLLHYLHSTRTRNSDMVTTATSLHF